MIEESDMFRTSRGMHYPFLLGEPLGASRMGWKRCLDFMKEGVYTGKRLGEFVGVNDPTRDHEYDQEDNDRIYAGTVYSGLFFSQSGRVMTPFHVNSEDRYQYEVLIAVLGRTENQALVRVVKGGYHWAVEGYRDKSGRYEYADFEVEIYKVDGVECFDIFGALVYPRRDHWMIGAFDRTDYYRLLGLRGRDRECYEEMCDMRGRYQPSEVAE